MTAFFMLKKLTTINSSSLTTAMMSPKIMSFRKNLPAQPHFLIKAQLKKRLNAPLTQIT